MSNLPRRWSRRLPLLALSLLTGCEADLSVDLTDGPVDDADAVVLGLTGVTLLTDAATTVSVPFGETRELDLLRYRSGATYRLIDGEAIANARYVGVALNFANGRSYVERSDGAIVAVETPDTLEFAELDLSLGENDEARIVLDLNLRFSLVDQTASTGSYALQPVLRAVQPDAAGTVQGVVAAGIVESDDCRQDRATTRGVAIYAFSGLNVTPADFAGLAGGPMDAAPVLLDTDSGLYRYSLHFLPAGSYTLALTCEADREDPVTADGLVFEAPANVTLDAGETATVNFL